MLIGSLKSRSSSRVMHMSFGMPLISAEHDPHLPALQFHRQAKSPACVAWIWWTASRTTMPSPTSAVYGLNSPPCLSPRQMWKVAFAIDGPSLTPPFRAHPSPPTPLPQGARGDFSFPPLPQGARGDF